ncbi:MAG TPA: maleylpyruvate isomerase family mycothiol-dependent enzyme, partial [Actinomycetota bacterium]|nr:maleylpyruvate isomerase family mycothiol-dependent enzyme [Actinomycetota bacterium]
IDYLRSLRDDGAALATAAGRGLDPPVPACEGWTVADLVLHTGMVHRHKLEIVRGHLAQPPDPWPPPAPPRAELLGWYSLGLEELLSVLEDADPETRVWTFHRPDQTVGFWRRRMAQETAVHRVDAESAHGDHRPVPAALAADGVAELLEVFLAPHADGEPVGGRGETLHLHATDTEGEWRLRLLPAGVEVGPGHDQADAEVAGGASDLLLFLWGRGDDGTLERSGDPALLPRVRELAAAATQ